MNREWILMAPAASVTFAMPEGGWKVCAENPTTEPLPLTIVGTTITRSDGKDLPVGFKVWIENAG